MTAAYNSDLHDALARARAELGLLIEQPVADGRIHRCAVNGGRRSAQDGSYRICLDPPANIWGQNFKSGIKKVICFGGSSGLWNRAEHQAFVDKMKLDRQARVANQQKAWAVAADRAKRIYSSAQPCAGHKYLTAKGVKPVPALRVLGPDLAVPLYNSFGRLRSLQFIDPAGQKRFLKGGQKGGCCLALNTGATNRRQALIICEGLATGLSLFESTGLETLVAFDAGNLKVAALGARRDWPERAIVLCADNDAGGAGNVGVTKAKEAALAVGGKMSVPFMPDGRACDFNDVFVDQGAETVRAFVEAAFIVEGAYNA